MAGHQAKNLQGKHSKGIRAAEQRKFDARVRRQAHRGTDAADATKIPFRLYRRRKTPYGRKTASDTLLYL